MMLPRIRLRHVLFIIFTLIASLPVVILALWVKQSALDKEIAAVEEKHLLVAHNLTGDLARYIIDVESSFQFISKNLLQDIDMVGVSEQLDSLFLRYIYVTNGDGSVSKQAVAKSSMQTRQIPEDTMQVLSPIMEQAQESPGKVLYSDMVRTGENETTFYLVEALPKQQYVVGALSTNHVLEAQKKVSFGRRGHAAIVDRTGRAIAHPVPDWVKTMKDMSFLPPVAEMKKGHTGVSKFFTPAMGADMVAGYTVVPRVGWGVMVPQPFEELEERADDVQIVALAIALGGIAIAGLISWYIAGVLSRPIQSVVDATRFKPDENQNPMVSEVSTVYRFIPHELRELLLAFNLMRRKLNNMTSKLHSKIDLANEEVQSQNLQLQKYSSKLLEANERLGSEIEERRKAQERSALQSVRLRSLYNATQLRNLSYDERILSVLTLGCEFFHVNIGRVCEINEAEKTNTTRFIIAPEDYGLTPGTVSSLEDTYCRIPFTTEQTIHIADVETSDWNVQSCFHYSRFRSYLATVIWVNGKKYGTISFASYSPRKDDFTDSDVDFIKIMAQWVGITMERRISEEKDTARSAAEAASQAKGTFLANMSHELRTPINAILGYGEMLLEDCEEQGNPQMKRDLEKIQTAGRHLTKLISSILDLSKIEAGKVDINYENVEIAGLVHEVSDTIRPLLEKNGNQFSVHLDKGVDAMFSDSTILQQILLNLLGNAAKFCKNGRVELNVARTRLRGIEHISFTIRDTGIGMSDEQLEIMFNEFTQANASSADEYGGIGLGLSIAKKYCALLKGEITASSKLGEGSTFCVILPNNISLASKHTNAGGK